ncbi:transposase [Streptomyces sp. NPDC094468]|uniref:IS701 family transposase n=1 Tax=Streptomyces sp. NPDC094468 TaxID=3366066 RepID=UPI00382AEE58
MDSAHWQKAFEVLTGRTAGRLVRVELRRLAGAFVLGLLSDLPRKNSWALAGQAGDANPYCLQHLLSRVKWGADAVGGDIRGFVVEYLRREDTVLMVDETGDLKKGAGTVGVQRQYTRTAGHIGNSQAAVCRAYSTPFEQAAIDRELYDACSWINDTARCQAAETPGDASFFTKPAPAVR